MALANVFSCAVIGLAGELIEVEVEVEVEVDVASGRAIWLLRLRSGHQKLRRSGHLLGRLP